MENGTLEIENQKSKIENPLDPLPLAALRLPAAIVDQLHSVGIQRVGQLRALPRESLLHRFGNEVLLRLDQALGRAPELLVPVREHEPVSVTRPFDGPTLSLEGIFLTLQEMLAQLTEMLLCQEAGIRGLRLAWVRFNAADIGCEMVTAAATRDAKHLWNLLRPKVEAMHMGYGVEAMTLTAFWIQTITHCQAGIWEDKDDAADRGLSEFLDTVANRWGADRVLAAAPAAAHVPEEAWSFAGIMRQKSGINDNNSFRNEANSKFPPIPFLDRPTCLLEPEPVEVLALQPDFPPSRIFWRGTWHAVSAGAGPERIVTPWWRVPPAPVRSVTRDYYKVQTHAGWLWLFRDSGNKWFVQGVWA
jgi:protein ImuB